jgi:hypothetical protein
MWSRKYKGFYIQGSFGTSQCQVLESPTGFGYTWRQECRSEHAAKLAITRRLKTSAGV